MNDITATFAMDITQQGSQITIILYLNPTSWVTDNAYWQEYGFSGVPPVGGGAIEFTGTVSSASFTADEQGSQLTQEHLVGTFTTDIITATLSGTSETTNQNGIVVMRTSSPTTGPTLSPTSTPSTTNQPTNRYFGNIGSVKGPAWTNDANGKTSLSSGQIYSGTEILTGDNAIVAFTPPDQGGTVYLGANSDAGWVALTSQPAPDNQIVYSIYPPVTSGVIFPNGIEQLKEMRISIPLEIAIAVLVFSEPLGQAAAVSLFVEGGAFLIPNGVAYIKETVSHLVAVPQGALAGENTEYVVNVSSDGTTTVQVISGPVVFIDPVTNNTVTIQSNQMLTLPSGQQSGFTEQNLQSDISTFNPASVNQWWTQTTANTSPLSELIDQPILLVVLVVAIAIVIVAIAVIIAKRRKKELIQPQIYEPPAMPPREQSMTLSGAKSPIYKMVAESSPQTAAEQPKVVFCPNCGNQLPMSKNFCPFCGFELHPEATESKTKS
jgi:hypothetical protein